MTATLPRDYRDMLECMLRHQVEFLLVGDWAVAVHGHQRATKDIDITTLIDGLDWPAAAQGAISVEVDGLRVPVIGRDALVANKLAAGRKQDLADAEALQRGSVSVRGKSGDP